MHLSYLCFDKCIFDGPLQLFPHILSHDAISKLPSGNAINIMRLEDAANNHLFLLGVSFHKNIERRYLSMGFWKSCIWLSESVLEIFS
mmetsp:Transcript_42786/g.130089  ORF Transcript_42786/g.130089 Transcript_42786/m.130089 type:complete len:88 (+) Transcript_42786:1156-1419(+)